MTVTFTSAVCASAGTFPAALAKKIVVRDSGGLLCVQLWCAPPIHLASRCLQLRVEHCSLACFQCAPTMSVFPLPPPTRPAHDKATYPPVSARAVPFARLAGQRIAECPTARPIRSVAHILLETVETVWQPLWKPLAGAWKPWQPYYFF